MFRVTRIALFILLVAVPLAGCGSSGYKTSDYSTYPPSPSASPSTASLSGLAGTWDGWGRDASGTGFPIQVTVNPDGTYASTVGASGGTGTFQVVDGKITTKGHLSGSAYGADRQAVVSVTEKNGRKILTGDGRSDRGPYSFELTKR